MEKNSASYSAKSEKHDEHKHLFGSGGKSDFIINMTPEGAQKLCGIYSMTAMILLALSSVPYYIAKLVEPGKSGLMLQTEHNSTLAFAIMTCLILTGFVGLLIFMIASVKKEVVIAKNKGLILFVLVVVSSLVSLLLAEDKMAALYGYYDRAEGLLSLIGYIGFFAIGVSLTNEKWRRAASGTIVGVGTANAAVGILQSIPALAKYIPSYYNFLFIGYRQNLTGRHEAVNFAEYFNTYAGYDASYAADGFTCSPFALALLLTVAVAFAVNRAAYAEKISSRIVNLVCSGVMMGAAIVTQTFPALIGIGCVLVVSFVIAAADKTGEGDKRTANKGAIVTSLLAIVTCGAIAAGVVLTDNFRLRDEHIMFTDSYERLGIAPYQHTPHEEDIYSTLRYEGWLKLEEHLPFGVGQDNWVTMYANGEGMETDRTYNEYLDIALARGIVGIVIYLAALVATLIKALRMLSGARSGKYGKAPAYGAFTAFVAVLVQAFFNISSNVSTPFFMITMGLIWSYEASTGKPEKQDKK